MDNARSMAAEADLAADYPAAREPRMEPPPVVGNDERRMHVRAYKFWVSLLEGRSFPTMTTLDPARLPDFGPHGVLLDFSTDANDPAIAFLGGALRAESGVAGPIEHVSDVPGRSLVSRLTDHYLQIIANRAPIGFEAEFVNARGNNTLYRGILMPFSSNGETIDHVYGVINWKETADNGTTTALTQEVGAALRSAPPPSMAGGPVWADGPGADPSDIAHKQPPRSLESLGDAALRAPGANEPGLQDTLDAARGTVDLLHSAEVRSRAALYRALGVAYDFTFAAERAPGEFAGLLRAAAIRGSARQPAAPAIKLVFGADFDRRRRAEFTTVLCHGRRLGIAPGGLRRMLEGSAGGVAAIVAAA